MNKNLKNPKWYSLIEIMTGILIVSIVMVSGFYALSAANIWKIRLINKWDIDKEAFYFQEKLIETIKEGGTIDYEEYFNRNILNIWKTNLYHSWHYLENSLYGNSSTPLYYCRSFGWTKMWTWGCVSNFNFSSSWSNVDFRSQTQVFWQYSYMAIDYNSDASWDNGDEDGDGSILRDDDDEYIGNIPSVFSYTGAVTELYLISNDKKKRTFLRWNIDKDPKGSLLNTCNNLAWDPNYISWNGCLGTIEVLKLEWLDWWYDHDTLVQDASQFDGVIDTWIYDRKFYGLSTPILAWNNEQYRIPLFSKDVHVKKIAFFLLPNKDSHLAWKDISPSVNIAPFVKISLILTPSLSRQAWIKWKIPEFPLTTTVNLSSLFSN